MLPIAAGLMTLYLVVRVLVDILGGYRPSRRER
jgi:hypothetical protein